jgi:hypothetical protein
VLLGADGVASSVKFDAGRVLSFLNVSLDRIEHIDYDRGGPGWRD